MGTLKQNQASTLYDDIPDKLLSLMRDFGFNNYSDHFSFKTSSTFNILERIEYSGATFIVNFAKINDHGYINKFFECVNSRLVDGGKFLFCLETSSQRKKRILMKYPIVLNYSIYTLDFIFHRVFPKMKVTRKFYFFIKGNRNRVVHEIEALGRAYSCGFKLLKKRKIKGITYVIVEKASEPSFSMEPSYGVWIKLNRVGKNGKKLKVRKLRSMYAYSEFLQEYIYENYSLAEGGKLKRDPRVSKAGKIFRKFWIDELPMIWNLIKGDLKLVGVRPLSPHYLSLYPEKAVEIRLETKPGLIPPFYYDLPKSFDEIVESELKYIQSYKTSPLTTDLKYLLGAFNNIVVKGARSS